MNEKKYYNACICLLILLIALLALSLIIPGTAFAKTTTQMSKTEIMGLFGGISNSLGPHLLFEEGSEEQAAVSLVRKAIDSEEILFWSSWFSKEFIKIALKICIGLTNDPFLTELAKLIDLAKNVYEAENLFEDWLARKNIKISKGTLTLTLVGYENKKVNIQYILLYYPENNERGKVASEFYSLEIVKCSKDPKGLGYAFSIWQLEGKISPFKLTINGRAEKTGFLTWKSYSFKIIGKPQVSFIKDDIVSGDPRPTQPPVINQPPNPPTNLSQMRASGAGIGVGATTNESTVVLKGLVSDPNNDTVKLQIELRRLDECTGYLFMSRKRG